MHFYQKQSKLPRHLVHFYQKQSKLPRYLARFYQKQSKLPRYLARFYQKQSKLPWYLVRFYQKQSKLPRHLACFYQKQAIVIPRRGSLRPVGVRIKFGTTQNGFKQNFINKELCNFSHFQVNVKSYDNFSLFVR